MIQVGVIHYSISDYQNLTNTMKDE